MTTESPSIPLLSIVIMLQNSSNPESDILNSVCFESILTQTFKRYEVLVISPTNNEFIPSGNEYAPIGLKFVGLQHTNINTALNEAIEAANGKYIHFIDANSRYSNAGTISQYISELEQSKFDFCYSDTVSDRQKESSDVRQILWKNTTNLQTFFFRTESVRNLNGFDTSLQHLAGTDLIVRALLNNLSYIKTQPTTTIHIAEESPTATEKGLSAATEEKVITTLKISRSEYTILQQTVRHKYRNIRDIIGIISKIPDVWGAEYLLRELLSLATESKSRVIKKVYYLFGCIPVYSTKTGIKG